MYCRPDEEIPKNILSPTREQKAPQEVADASASVSGMGTKWKMQVGTSVAGGLRFKKQTEKESTGEQEKQPPAPTKTDSALERNIFHPNKNKKTVRKVLFMKKGQRASFNKVMSEPVMPRPKILPVASTTNPLVAPRQVVLDKFGNFRLVSPPASKKPTGGGQSTFVTVPPKSYAGRLYNWRNDFVVSF